MEHTLYACELPYPEVEAAPCLADAKLLMPDYGGPQGELTAVTTYCFQHYITSASRPELAEALAGIAKVEMRHHALLGETVFTLGGYPVMGGRTYWNGSFADYTLSPEKFLARDIHAEEAAILAYERTVLALRTESVKLLIERIILDEELHIKLLRDLIASL